VLENAVVGASSRLGFDFNIHEIVAAELTTLEIPDGQVLPDLLQQGSNTLRSRNFRTQQVEVNDAIAVLNRMAALGLPSRA